MRQVKQAIKELAKRKGISYPAAINAAIEILKQEENRERKKR